MKLEEVKSNPEILNNLRWDLTPQNSNFPNGVWHINSPKDIQAMHKFLQAKAGYYFFVNVYNCQASLALAHNQADGNTAIYAIDDFHSSLLEQAVEDAGGSITTSGWYPLNKPLRKRLKRLLYSAPEDASPEERVEKQLIFIEKQLDNLSISAETKAKVLELIGGDLRLRLPQLMKQMEQPRKNASPPAIQVNPQDHGKCVCCGAEDVDLTDGFLCRECFDEHEKDSLEEEYEV